MLNYPILSVLTFLPLISAFAILCIRGSSLAVQHKNSKHVALWASVINLLLSLLMLCFYDSANPNMQFVEYHPWIEGLNTHYHVGVDGISIFFVVLTALLTPICVLVSWHTITERVKSYMACFLALEGFVIGVFCALDLVQFYIMWEAMLIPMFLIIGVWGGKNRIYAALKFFLYTFVGSVLMLVAIFYLHKIAGSFGILDMANTTFTLSEQKWLFVALAAAFAVKIPMWPCHTWLPDAHVQAPTAGSVILAGILLKMGGYGFLRFSLPMFPDATAYFAPVMIGLSVIAIIYAALVAFAQTDVKKMIAYSSVSHMGFVTLGIFAGTEEAVQGAVLQMLNHGVVSAALFMLVGCVYDRMHTRDLAKFGGIVHAMPVYAVIFGIMTMAAVALPGTNSFVGEFLVLVGSFPVAQLATSFAILGVVLGAVYMLWLYRKMVLGAAISLDVRKLKDLSLREQIMFAPLVALVLWVGLFPQYMLSGTQRSVEALVQDANNENTVIIEPLSRIFKPYKDTK